MIIIFNITSVGYVANRIASRRSNKVKFKDCDECRNVCLAAVATVARLRNQFCILKFRDSGL